MQAVPRSVHPSRSSSLRRTVVGRRPSSRAGQFRAGVTRRSSPLLKGPPQRWPRYFAAFWVLAVAVVASPVAAHTGLGTSSGVEGFLHPFGGLDHLLAMVVVGVLASLAAARSVAWLTPLAFVAGMVGGAGLGIAGVPLPGAEIGIAVSVIVLGVLLGGIVGEFGSWLPPTVALFGVAHGYAHGAELPGDAVPLLYVLGFVGATAVLHVVGAGVGLRIRRMDRVRTAMSAAVSAAGAAILLTF